MKKTKILLTRSMLAVDCQYITDGLLREVGDTFELVKPDSYDEAGLLEFAVDADVFLGPYVTKPLLEAAKNLKLIQVPWTGMDTFSFAAVEGTDVPVCNSHSNAAVVAELGAALILDLYKKISYHDRKMRLGNWNREQRPLDLKSRMLCGQVACIVGYGSIGSRLGAFLQTFGMDILAVKTKKEEIPGVECHAADELPEIVGRADLVVLTIPLTDATRKLVDRSFIRQMKDGAMMVTLSRAEVVDEDALYEALLSGKLSGYGSDVWWAAPKRGESESWVSSRHRFEDLDQVVLSPHRAGFCENSLPHLDDAIANIARLIRGKPLINVVKTAAGY